MDFDPKERHVVVGKCGKCGVLSERYVNCKSPECNRHFLCCENCSEIDGRAFCGRICRDTILSTGLSLGS